MTIDDLRQTISTWKFTKERVVHLLIGLFAILAYEFFARPVYRPYVYRNNIDDFHLADTIGNTLGTMATIFVLIGVIGDGRIRNLFLIKLITVSVVLYEVAHPLLGKPIDVLDIVATVLIGGVCFLTYRRVYPKPYNEFIDR